MKTIDYIESELQDLLIIKKIAYMDYLDNEGNNSGLREELWRKFKQHRDRWNILVIERKKLLSNI